MVQRGRRSVWAAVWTAVTVATLAAGCGDTGGGTGPGEPGDSSAWRTSTDPVPTSGLAWAVGSTVHLSDGTTIDTGGFVNVFLVAGDGVFFVPAESEEDAGSGLFTDQELQFAAPGKPATGTGVVVSHDFVAASPDGRYLAAIDTASGEEDRFGTPQASVVAFDLQTGEQVVDSTLGMGDPDEDDFADLYSELEMRIVAVTDGELHVDTSGDFVFDLATGEGEELTGDEPTGDRPPVRDGGLVSPGGAWRIEMTKDGPVRLLGDGGAEVIPSTEGPRWILYGWADDQTAFGIQISGPSTGLRIQPGDSTALMGCQVPSGECEVFDETTGQTVVLPLGPAAGARFILQDGRQS